MAGRKARTWIGIFAVAAVAAGTGAYFWKKHKEAEVRFRTSKVERGNVQVSVTATGTLQALVTVQVGTQVSGPIASINADFNSEVKKGQVIARLDTTLLHAALEDSRSSYSRMAAQEKQAAETLKRTKALADRALVSQAELDQAVAAAQVAAANLTSARFQVDRARINLGYATITSPIDGIVLNRAVDVGQTVAASFNTPTLFTIAGDLREMEVKASVDEADIGKVQTGQKATFTVDAYPEATFAGTVQQVRLEPKVDQNVVSYDVVIRVPNPDLRLMPGMTANLTIAVTAKENVLVVPAAALRFRPPGDTASSKGNRGGGAGKDGGWAEGGNRRDSAAGPRDTTSRPDWKHGREAAAGDSSAVTRGGGKQHGGHGKRGDGDTTSANAPDTQGAHWNGGKDSGGGSREGGGNAGYRPGRIYLMVDGKPKPVRIRTGLSDGSRTEVVGEVSEGDTVVVGIENAAATQGAAKPFGMTSGQGGNRGAGGGGRRGF